MAPHPCVLLVDDDDVDREAAARAFTRRGVREHLYLAESGPRALAMLRDPALLPRRPAIVLLDLCMPEMTGLELLAELRRDPALAALQVVVTTVSSLEADVRAALALGAQSYLIKPTEYDQLATLVGDGAGDAA